MSNLSKTRQDAINEAIIKGDIEILEQALIEFKDDPFIRQYDEALKAHRKESASSYEKACTIIAYKQYFNNWSDYEKFRQELTIQNSEVALFEKAVDAVVKGDIITLKNLLHQHPDLIRTRSVRNHHATLLIYVGANGIEDYRQQTPLNAVEIAETLIKAGAEVDAIGDMYRGTTTLGSVATSVHPVKAGLQKELVDVLLKYGADINHGVAPDYTDGLLINACLHNGRCEIVPYLAARGAILDLEGAAGAGILEEVKKYYHADGSLTENADQAKRDLGFMWACECGRKNVVEFMLEKGFDLSTLADGMTGLHWAVVGGQVEIIELLLKHHAPLEIKNCYGGTVLGQALWSAYNDPKPQDAVVIDILINAGAKVEDGWEKYIEAIKKRSE